MFCSKDSIAYRKLRVENAHSEVYTRAELARKVVLDDGQPGYARSRASTYRKMSWLQRSMTGSTSLSAYSCCFGFPRDFAKSTAIKHLQGGVFLRDTRPMRRGRL